MGKTSRLFKRVAKKNQKNCRETNRAESVVLPISWVSDNDSSLLGSPNFENKRFLQ
jgi:hypothetical protein